MKSLISHTCTVLEGCVHDCISSQRKVEASLQALVFFLKGIEEVRLTSDYVFNECFNWYLLMST